MTKLKKETTKGKYSYRFSLSIGFSNDAQKHSVSVSVFGLGFDEDGWNRLSEEDRQEVLDESLQKWLAGLLGFGWEVKQ